LFNVKDYSCFNKSLGFYEQETNTNIFISLKSKVFVKDINDINTYYFNFYTDQFKYFKFSNILWNTDYLISLNDVYYKTLFENNIIYDKNYYLNFYQNLNNNFILKISKDFYSFIFLKFYLLINKKKIFKFINK